MPLALLALAKPEPLKAYEFIAELERLFGPSYRPSPGGVYPALKALTVEGLLTVERDGRAKRYRLTDDGRTALERRRRQLAALEARTSVDVEADAALRLALERFTDTVVQCAGLVDVGAVDRVLDKAAKEIVQLTTKGAGDGKKR